MPRDTSTDTISDDLIARYVTILSPLAGWGTLADSSRAVYPHLGLPMPQEPFPAAYVYIAGVQHDWTQGEGYRRDNYTVTVRIIGGQASPGARVSSGNLIGVYPENAVYKMLTGVWNEFTYRPFLQDPTNNNEPFRYIDPDGRLALPPAPRIQTFSYSDQGLFIGMEIPTTITLRLRVGRVS